jgi:hypothetical protein
MLYSISSPHVYHVPQHSGLHDNDDVFATDAAVPVQTTPELPGTFLTALGANRTAGGRSRR